MYKNYGDVNFFDNGVLVKRVSDDAREFEIITCNYDADVENQYILETGTIIIDEIDRVELLDVCKWADMPDISNGDYEDHEKLLYQLAVNCFNYSHWFASDYECKLFTRNEVIDFIDHGYIDELDWEFYENNFMENRNCVAEFHDNYGQSWVKVFDSYDDAVDEFRDVSETGWSITIISK